MIAYLEEYAAGAPVSEHTTVLRAGRERGGFVVETDRGERRERLLQREAEIMISDLEGIASADVQINRAPGRSPGSRTGKVAALVRIHPVDGQPLTARIYPNRPEEAIHTSISAASTSGPDSSVVLERFEAWRMRSIWSPAM